MPLLNNLLLLGLAQSAQAIVGGIDATPSTAPFAVSISSKGYYGESHICGGILRDANTVITAAVCCDGQAASDLSAKYGGLDRTNLQKASSITLVKLHPRWDAQTLDNNVCLLKLGSAATEGSGIAYARLAAQPPTVDDELIIVGWGRTTVSGSGSALSKYLQQMDAKVSSKPECAAVWKTYTKPMPITDRMVCDVGVASASVCVGDVGGPVIMRATEDVVGLTSNGTLECTSSPEPNISIDFTKEGIRNFIYTKL